MSMGRFADVQKIDKGGLLYRVREFIALDPLNTISRRRRLEFCSDKNTAIVIAIAA
jgi:hypothetical protein